MINGRDLSFSRGVAEEFWPVTLGRVVIDVRIIVYSHFWGHSVRKEDILPYDIGFREFNAMRFRSILIRSNKIQQYAGL